MSHGAPRVLIVNPSFSAGAFTHQLANALVDAGASVDVWTSPHFERISGSWSAPRYRPQIRFYRRTHRRSWTTGPTRLFWRAARFAGHVMSCARLLLAAGRYDVVHVYFLTVPGFDALWFPWLRRRTRVAYHVHNLYPHDAAKDPTARRRFGRVYRSSDVLFAHTDATERGLIQDFGIPASRIVRVPLGHVADLMRPDAVADPQAIGFAAGGSPVILMLGDIRRNKGIDVLIEALSLLNSRGVAARVMIAGRQPAGRPTELEELAQRLGVGHLVEFRYQFVPEEEIAAYLRAAAVIAFPYRMMDSQSAGAVWALSQGRPIVASKVGGLAWLLEQSGAGLLVTPENPAALAAALETLLRDRERAEAMGRAGHDWALRALDWTPIAATTLRAYQAGTA